MSWVLAIAGFSVLIVLHELGHFAVAKAVGMRVERFSLFFPPYLLRRRRGETEYCLGSLPIGGLVKISGMSPHEQLPAEVLPRAYLRQPVWKRVAVIAAGPAMNVVVAFALLWGLYAFKGDPRPVSAVGAIERGAPAAGVLRPGDRLLSVDGSPADADALHAAITDHHCAGPPTPGCRATTPAHVVVLRGRERREFPLFPVYDATPAIRTTRLGFTFDLYAAVYRHVSPVQAIGKSVSGMWRVTSATLGIFGRIFDSQQRKQLSGIVGTSNRTQQLFSVSLYDALTLLAFISLSLAIVNLFPFLPLDGGHIFWALAEKVRGRAIPFAVLERASVVGVGLVLMLFAIGLSNDIHRLSDSNFGLTH